MSSQGEIQRGNLAVELRCIGFDYNGTVVLEDLQWQVSKGEFHTLLGASGSGKTTLLKLISGLQRPSRGSLWMAGRESTKEPSHQRGIALVGQTAATYDHLSVLANLRLAVNLSARKELGLQEELVDQFELAGVLSRKPGELSGGQLQRLAIVRALLSQRPILLMDEPLAHLQESLRSPIRKLLRRWQQERELTCIYVTHDSQEAFELSDRISVMGDSKVLQTGDLQSVYRRPSSKQVAELLGRPPVQWHRSDRRAAALGLRPTDWRVLRAKKLREDFEEVFEAQPQTVRVVGRLVGSQQVESWDWWEVQAGTERILAVGSFGAWHNEAVVGSCVELTNAYPIWL
jgi:putative spermidine/putrescine transport system ATP-binding protein